MYKANNNTQISLDDFEQPMGMHLNPENRWVRLAKIILWSKYENRYKDLFKSTTGNVAKPFRLALGSLIIQKKLGFSDRELVEQITENPYLQYFIGLPKYQETPPFDPSTLVSFRKRIDLDMAIFLNDSLLMDASAKQPTVKKPSRKHNNDKNDKDKPSGSGKPGAEQPEKHKPANDPPSDATTKKSEETDEQQTNAGTLILDATCAPSNIRFPQDFSLLNESRENLERIIRRVCRDNGERLPRTYCRKARKNYLGLAKCRRRGAKKIRKVIRRQLGYVKRDLGYIDGYLAKGYVLQTKELKRLETIRKVYEQQKEMFDNHSHKVANRIVSLSQPYIRPIIRGKAKSPVEFGIKFDLSVDEHHFGRIEKITFDAYNEQETLQRAVEGYKKRTGHYPERVLADQIYRNRENRKYCREHGIRMSGPKLGRPSAEPSREERRTAYRDNTDRIEVERSFSLSKRCYGLGLIKTKLEETSYGSVGLSIFVTNLFRILDRSGVLFFAFFKEHFRGAMSAIGINQTGFILTLNPS